MAAKKKSMTPAVRYLRYELTNSGTPGTERSHYIDLAHDLSRVNRRLYRQGRDYHVKRITIVSSNTPNGGNRVSFSTVPNSWVTQRAWQRGFKTWNMMNKKASAAVANDISGKFSDFKIYLSDDHRTGLVLTPKDNGGNNANSGDWDYSQLVSPDGTTSADDFYLHMLGNHVTAGAGNYTSVGLVKSYGESRTTVDTDQPNVPSTVSDDPLVNVFDDGTVTDEVINLLEGDNDAAPYGTNNYAGDDANMPKPIVVQDTTIVDGRATVGGFVARCGLIEIESTSPLASDVERRIEYLLGTLIAYQLGLLDNLVAAGSQCIA
jgi:hypothetical protein